VSGPLDPVGVADRLMALDGPVIRGNHDRWLVQGRRDDRDLDPTDSFVRQQLRADQLAWLAALPATAVFSGEIFLCHGTPVSDDAAWLNGWYQQRTATMPN